MEAIKKRTKKELIEDALEGANRARYLANSILEDAKSSPEENERERLGNEAKELIEIAEAREEEARNLSLLKNL